MSAGSPRRLMVDASNLTVGFLRDALSDHLRFGWFEFHERTAPAASRRALHTNCAGNCGNLARRL